MHSGDHPRMQWEKYASVQIKKKKKVYLNSALITEVDSLVEEGQEGGKGSSFFFLGA